MQAEEYNRRGKELVDYITQYLGSIRERRVIPDVKPGYMRDLIPESAPVEAEDWDNIFNDIERVIMPGVVHWQSPYMHAYYPSLTSWPSLLGDMLADAINCVGFTWASSPACTELEMNVMDWLCKALGLPSFFLHHHPDSRGGGILQVCATLGTTGVCAFDRLSELGPICIRRFRSLKLWFVLRSFGLKNLQAHIRHRGNAVTQELLRRLTRSGSMYMIPAEIRTKRIIRFTVTSQVTTEEDILRDWGIISKTAAALLSGSRSRSGEDEVIQVGEESPTDKPETEEQEDDVLTALDSRHVELWIDKAWTRTRRPMRSLSCNSEPLPYIYNLGCNCDQNVLFKESATATQAPTPTTSTGPMYTITERPSSEALGKQVLKKLTKFYSVPSFCNPWVQCGRHPLCCPLKANQGNQKHLSSSCRRINCVSNPVAANTVAPPNTPLENGAKTAL
uniref:Histidine decarboxylase n=1 Tax=Neogobius melanostomus TaxID=47308 RepID=A0A8C6U0L0_9GOBI